MGWYMDQNKQVSVGLEEVCQAASTFLQLLALRRVVLWIIANYDGQASCQTTEDCLLSLSLMWNVATGGCLF